MKPKTCLMLYYEEFGPHSGDQYLSQILRPHTIGLLLFFLETLHWPTHVYKPEHPSDKQHYTITLQIEWMNWGQKEIANGGDIQIHLLGKKLIHKTPIDNKSDKWLAEHSSLVPTGSIHFQKKYLSVLVKDFVWLLLLHTNFPFWQCHYDFQINVTNIHILDPFH